jgi:arylsulfatase A-like enzyme
MPTRPFDRLRRSPLSALLALALGCAACSRETRTNVVLVTLDTTRADYLGAYGKSGDPTPNLDALAAQGTRFDLAISSAALTPVSHASILTGLENREHGLRVLSAQSGFRLRSDVPTLATVLHGAGYRTAAVHSAFPVSSYFGFQNGFDAFESVEGQMGRLRGNAARRTWDLAKFQRRSDETTDLALDWLKSTKSPFFLWIHYWDPHDDVLVPPPERLPANLRRIGADGQPQPSLELYAAEVSYVDAQIGRLIAALKASGKFEHTLFVVVADHGEGLGDHGWDHHRILYQEQIRVPLIVRVPGAKQAAEVADLVRTIDIYPTVLDYLGVLAPKPVSGASLRPLIEGRPDPPRIAFADQINGYDWNASMVDSHPQFDFLYCAMDRDWKLIYRPSHPDASELYEIARDPREEKNLFRERADEALRLERKLARQDGWVTAPFGKDASAPDPKDAQHALDVLGYTTGGSQDGAPSPQWSWTCPEHASVRQDARGKCPTCGTPLIPVRRGT